MFEEFYEMYEPEEREADVLIQKILGASMHGTYWNMMAVTLGMVFCDTGEVNIREGRLRWPVTEEERNSGKGWGRFRNGQICRVRVRKLRDVHTPEHTTPEKFNCWYAVKVLRPKVSCAQLEAVWAEYIKPVVVEDEILGSLTLNRDFKQLEGTLAWGGSEVSLALDIDPENRSTWTRARGAAKKLLADCETWDRAMREFAAKKFTGLANDWLPQDEENPRDPETDPITEEELARRISMTSLSVTSGGSFTAFFDCDEMFTDHAVAVYGSLKKGLKAANIEG